MYNTENYFTEDLLNDDLLQEDFIQENLDENFDESRLRRPFGRIRFNPSSELKRKADFGRNLFGRGSDYVSKTELQNQLKGIASEVNELKKSTIGTAKALEKIDAKFTTLSKIDDKKNSNQTTVLKRMQMTSMLASLMNKPKILAENLEINRVDNTIKVKDGKDGIEVDNIMSMLLPMMTTMGEGSNGGGQDNSMMMMLPILMMDKKDSNNTKDNMPLLMMLMMMGNK